jgi:hypothetical protein
VIRIFGLNSFIVFSGDKLQIRARRANVGDYELLVSILDEVTLESWEYEWKVTLIKCEEEEEEEEEIIVEKRTAYEVLVKTI